MDQKQTISIEVENKPGVLSRISTLFSRRGYNVESLAVAHTHIPGISRFTIVVEGDDDILEQIRKQSQKLIHVLTTENLEPNNSICREFAFIKMDYNDQTSEKINRVIDFYGGRMLDHSDGVLIVEFSGSEQKIDQIFAELKEIPILEAIRSGKVGIRKGRWYQSDPQKKLKTIFSRITSTPVDRDRYFSPLEKETEQTSQPCFRGFSPWLHLPAWAF